MPVDFEITENGWITRLTITDPWDVTQMMDKFGIGLEVRNQSSHKIYALIDVHGTRTAPPGSLRLRASPVFTHPKSGYTAVIGANALARSLIEMLLKLSRKKNLGFFDSESDALAYLRSLIEAEVHATS
jgi:hypothetical protein